MIVDNLKTSQKYENLNPLFKQAFEYLRSMDFQNLELGKSDIVGKDVFINVQTAMLKNQEESKLEVHDKYIDIQLPVSKSEGFGWVFRDELKEEVAPFNYEKDVQHYKDKAKTYFKVEPGDFVIFFPEDAHAPCIGEGEILKIVVKVKA